MELGNLVFGNSRGEFPIDRGLEGIFYTLLEAIDPTNPGYTTFENEVFVTRPYYWGDCSCGHEEAAYAWEQAHPHMHKCYQTELHKRLAVARQKVGKSSSPFDVYHQTADDFNLPHVGSAVHCTCGRDKEWVDWVTAHDHADSCPTVLPNFHFKPTNLRIAWYKYPLRDSYSNVKLDKQLLFNVVSQCLASLKKSEEA